MQVKFILEQRWGQGALVRVKEAEEYNIKEEWSPPSYPVTLM